MTDPLDDRPKVGVAVFVLKDNKFIMLLRKGSHGAGSWGLAGGHLERGESWEACAIRETREEVGLEIKNIRFVAVTNDIFTGKDSGKHYVTIYMRADWAGGEASIQEPLKCAQLAWFSYQTMPENVFSPLIKLKEAYPNLIL